MDDEFKRIFQFLHLAEKLKCELRHCDLSNGRRESVADHVWRTSLMAMVIAPRLQKPVNLEKTLKMIIIHDIVEALSGDVPIFEAEKPEIKIQKMQNEQAAILEIKNLLNSPVGEEIFALWYEFEDKESEEAKFAHTLDKLEAQLQHNESHLDTWLPVERTRVFYKLEEIGEHDPYLKQCKNHLKQQALHKLESGGCDLSSLEKEARLHQQMS